ncbi:transposase [candidate division KSB1 bacterium]
MVVTQFGRIITAKWKEIPRHFGNTELDEFIIMPNHLHGVLFITDVGAKHSERKKIPYFRELPENASTLQMAYGTKTGSLSAIIQNYKSVTIRKINQIRKTKGAKLWQRNYYEHVIRNKTDLHQIREYIIANPLKWELDKENPQNWIMRNDR